MSLALLAVIVTLILVVGIHEAGHALAAKVFGVKIQRIAIGFGKPLLKWKDKSQREWVWAIWPLGGSVHLLNSRIEPVSTNDFPLCFDKKPIWVRCIILVSGALANFLTAWLALMLMFMLGYQQQLPIIQGVMTQSIAAQAGLKANDRFVEIAGKRTNSWQEVGMCFIMNLGKVSVPIVINNGTQTRLNLSQWHYKKQDRSLLDALGIKPASGKAYTHLIAGQSFFVAAEEALAKSLHLLVFFLVMLKQLFIGAIPFEVLLGPIGLLVTSVSSFFQGVAVFLYFIASLSLTVGLSNLFPVPGLDGGSIVYALVEKCLGRPVSVAVEILLYRLALILFAMLLIQLLMNDLERYIISNSARTTP